MSSPTSSPAAGRTVADGSASTDGSVRRAGGCAGAAPRPRNAPVTMPNRLRDGAGGSVTWRGGSENSPERDAVGLAFGSW